MWQYRRSCLYSPARNLTSWTRVSTTKNYTWDRNNNRLTDGTTTTSYRLDNSIGAVTTAGVTRNFTYDRVGLLINDGCQASIYDDFDRVEKVTKTSGTGCDSTTRVTEYTYDGLDRQRTMAVSGASVSAANGTTANVFDGVSSALVGQTGAVTAANDKPKTLYQLRSSGESMALKQDGAAPAKSYLDTDGQGSVTTQVNTSDGVSCAVAYDPYGLPIAPTSATTVCASGTQATSTANTNWYRGQTRDGSTGDYQLGSRTYDPNSGTFIAPDSYRVADPDTDLSVGVDPLTANTYTYVNGNPVNLADPSGHRADCGGASCDGQVTPSGKPLSTDQKIVGAQYRRDVAVDSKAQLQKKANAKLDKKAIVVDVLGEVSGINDILKCIDGSVSACLMSVGGVVGGAVFKAAKTAKKVKKIQASISAFNKAKNVAKAGLRGADDAIAAASKELDQARRLARMEKRANAEASSTVRKSAGKARPSGKSSGGRRGNAVSRDHLDEVRDDFLTNNPDYKHVAGGRDAVTGESVPEEYLPPLDGGRRGGSYPDLTFASPDGTRVRINTVDSLADGRMTPRESANFDRIYEQTGGPVIAIPKRK